MQRLRYEIDEQEKTIIVRLLIHKRFRQMKHKAVLTFAALSLLVVPHQAVATYCSISNQQISYCSKATVCQYIDNDLRGDIARKEAARRGLTCNGVNYGNAKIQISPLRAVFSSLPSEERRQIQTNLYLGGYYAGSIDGLYGRKTAAAIQAFTKDKLPELKPDNSSDIRVIMSSILEENFTMSGDEEDSSDNEEVIVSSGTGFFVSQSGNLVTNYHVVEGCSSVKAVHNGETLDAKLLAYDQLNDLAVLEINTVPSEVIPLSNDSPYPMQDLIVAGYPFGENFSSTIKFTKGIVSSLAGLGNNYSQIQIDAAIQPGNSGGPIVDENGNAIAVAVAKLSISHVLKNYGVVPENTNFGVKISAVKNLLDGNGVAYSTNQNLGISKQQLAKNVTSSTLYLTCWMDEAQIYKMLKKKLMFEKYNK